MGASPAQPDAAGSAAAGGEPAHAGMHGASWWPPSRAAVAALLVGLLITAALALTSLAVYNKNEDRLLHLRVRELNLVLAATAPSVQTPLASAAELASATGGNTQKFRAFIAPYVGVGKQFVSVSLWPLGSARPSPVAVVGAAPLLASAPDGAARFRALTGRPRVLNLTLLNSAQPHLAFAFGVPGSARGFAAYAENPLPANRRSRLEGNSAFSDLDYALYFGRSARAGDLLLTSVKTLPMRGRTASEVVPFGAGSFALVVKPKGSLGGSFFRDLPWIIAFGGALIALAAAVLTDRLARRRRRAEELAATLDRVAAENRRMYMEQRGIAQTLQQALLPRTLPELDGMSVAARYVPAASGAEVGGDWYDVIALKGNRLLLVIGDVSGHGLEAATTMALVRHAALAYVAEDPGPGSVLDRLSDFVNSAPHDYFATMLCVLVEVDARRVTVASAGHLPPLLLGAGERGEFVDCGLGPPIGVPWSSPHPEVSVSVPAHATLIAFTDGLVERRGEILDAGLARLLDLASAEALSLDDLLAKLAGDLTSENHDDDTALVGIQWQS